MGLKRIVGLLIFLGIATASLIYLRSRNTVPAKLRVSTWSNYFPDSVLQDFTSKTGIKVELSYISSNEELFAKLKAGATGFDIVQPSDYMVRQMKSLSMLSKLDPTLLPNLIHLEDYYRHLSYDPGNEYSVPFTWGTSGIAVNTAKVKLTETEVSWKLLLNSSYPRQTSLLDDMREVFSAVLFLNHLSPSTRDLGSLVKTKQEISQLKNHVLMFNSEPKPLLLREEVYIAHIFSSDAVQAQQENPAIQYFIPKEGGLIWTDNFAIPASSQHKLQAHTFINYFLSTENAIETVRQSHLATPNSKVKDLLPPEEKNNPNIYPPKEVLKKLFFLEDIGDTLPIMNRMWTELKS
jgi:spermidine/putrescine transport system substrate-binding protein